MKKLPLILIAALVQVVIGTSACEIMPRNHLKDCMEQCKDSRKSKACIEFCDCIHNQGQPLDSCLDKYDKDQEDSVSTP